MLMYVAWTLISALLIIVAPWSTALQTGAKHWVCHVSLGLGLATLVILAAFGRQCDSNTSVIVSCIDVAMLCIVTPVYKAHKRRAKAARSRSASKLLTAGSEDGDCSEDTGSLDDVANDCSNVQHSAGQTGSSSPVVVVVDRVNCTADLPSDVSSVCSEAGMLQRPQPVQNRKQSVSKRRSAILQLPAQLDVTNLSPSPPALPNTANSTTPTSLASGEQMPSHHGSDGSPDRSRTPSTPQCQPPQPKEPVLAGIPATTAHGATSADHDAVSFVSETDQSNVWFERETLTPFTFSDDGSVTHQLLPPPVSSTQSSLPAGAQTPKSVSFMGNPLSSPSVVPSLTLSLSLHRDKGVAPSSPHWRRRSKSSSRSPRDAAGAASSSRRSPQRKASRSNLKKTRAHAGKRSTSTSRSRSRSRSPRAPAK